MHALQLQLVLLQLIIARYRLARVCICHIASAYSQFMGSLTIFAQGHVIALAYVKAITPLRVNSGLATRDYFMGCSQLASSTTILKYQLYIQLATQLHLNIQLQLHCIIFFTIQLSFSNMLLLVKFTKSELMLVELQWKNLPAKKSLLKQILVNG